MVARCPTVLWVVGWLLVGTVHAAGPVNDAIANAKAVSPRLPVQVQGNLDGATMEPEDPAAAWGGWTRSIWWTWTSPSTGPVEISAGSPSQDLAVGILAEQDGELRLAAFNDDAIPGIEVAPALRLFASANRTYWIGVVSGDEESGPFKLSLAPITNAPDNDSLQFAEEIAPRLPVTVTGNSTQATVEAFEPLHAGEPIGHSVWWKWTPDVSTNVVIQTLGSDYDTLLGVYSGSDLSRLTEVDSNDDAGGATSTSAVRIRVFAGTTYYLAVDGFDNAAGNIRLSIAAEALPQAPDWTLPSVDGTDISWSQYAGKVVVLCFWATWCGSCADDLSNLIQLQQQYGSSGLQVIGVSVDSDPQSLDAVRSFVVQHQIPYDIVWDRQGSLADLFGRIVSVPTTVLIDRNGHVVETYVGTQSKERFGNEVGPLLVDSATFQTPSLVITPAGESFTLSWDNPGAEFQATGAGSLAGPWEPLSSLPIRTGSRRELTVPSTGHAFFRLILP